MTVFEISIHALLAESDLRASAHLHTLRNFYPRSPCGERRPLPRRNYAAGVFLSTLSLRRATTQKGSTPTAKTFLSTLSLRRATGGRRAKDPETGISIHALLAESDPVICETVSRTRYFYPRSPCGERLAANKEAVSQLNISIHALLAESDLTTLAINSYADYISIHALLAESDPGKVKVVEPGLVFLSTLSLRRATA